MSGKFLIGQEVILPRHIRGIEEGEDRKQQGKRPLQNPLFCPIFASGSNFNPQNIQYIPPVKILAFLELEQN
jgi:hypothetical protein